MKEWKVLRNGQLWSDRLKSEEFAEEEINESIMENQDSRSDYEIVQMSQEEIDEYLNQYRKITKTNDDIARDILKVVAAFITIRKLNDFPIEINTNDVALNLASIVEKANKYDAIMEG